MRKTSWLVSGLILAAFVLGAGAWFFFVLPGEPTFDGEPVSYWFKEYSQCRETATRSDARRSEAYEALRKMGTNAVPYLIKMALTTGEDSAVRKAFGEFLDDLPESWHQYRFVGREEIRQEAVSVIRNIKPPANMLLARLPKVLGQTNSLQYRAAISILSCAGEGREMLVPYFAKALQTSDPYTKRTAVQFLQQAGPKATAAVPDLILLLQTTDRTNYLHMESAFTLGSIGSNASSALPLLRTAFEQETNWVFRCCLAAALCRIDAGETNALSYLIGNLSERADPNRLRWPASRLRFIGPNAKSAIPALVEALTVTNLEVWTGILDSLKEIGASPDLFMSKLTAKLKSEDEKSRFVAAARILAIAPADTEAQWVMTELVRSHSEYEHTAIVHLAATGTNAHLAIPAILETLNGSNVLSWVQVPKALVRIGVPKELFLPKLKEKLKSSDDLIRLKISEEILAISPGDRDALQTLVDCIKRQSKYTRYALDVLGEAGPATQETIAVVREQLKSKERGVRWSAAHALKKIESRKPDK